MDLHEYLIKGKIYIFFFRYLYFEISDLRIKEIQN